MISVTADLGSHEFGLRILLGTHRGSQISTEREDFASDRVVFLTLSKGLVIELSDFEAGNSTLKGDYLRHVVEIVSGGIPTILEVRFVCLFMSLSRILLEGSELMSLFSLKGDQVDHRKVEVSIQLLRNVYPVPDMLLPGVHFVPLLGRHPSFSICFLL